MRKLLYVFFLLCQLQVYGQNLPDDIVFSVNETIKKYDKPNSPGFVVALIKDNKVVYKNAVGLANMENDISNTTQTVFSVASVSKQFTASAIALLHLEGKLRLEDAITKYIPELPECFKQIKIKHLIYHQSGIRDFLFVRSLMGIGDDVYNMTEGEALELISHQEELYFQPGAAYDYCNSNYFLMAQIVKRVSKKNLRDYCEEKIFKPLGMKNTHFHNDVAEIVKNRAIGYYTEKENIYKIAVDSYSNGLIGSGKLYSTLEDLCLWDKNFYDYKVGGKEFVSLITAAGHFNNGRKGEYAFGLFNTKYKGLKMIWHDGASRGYLSNFVRFPDERFSVICLTNSSNINPELLTDEIVDMVLEAKSDPKLLKKVKYNPKFLKLNPQDINSKTGDYRNIKTDNLWTINFTDGKVLVKNKSSSFEILPVGRNEYQSVQQDFPYKLSFSKDCNIKVYENEKEFADLEPVVLAKPTKDELKEYEGVYYNEELKTNYTVFSEKDELHIQLKKYKPVFEGTLHSWTKDVFKQGTIKFEFKREADKVDKLILTASRIGSLVFKKAK